MVFIGKLQLPFSALIAAHNPVPSGQTGTGRRRDERNLAGAFFFSFSPGDGTVSKDRPAADGNKKEIIPKPQIVFVRLPQTHRRERIGNI